MKFLKLGLALAATLLLSGCFTGLAPYLGHWVGSFEVEQAAKGVPVDALNLKGYVQLYQTGDRCLLELANPAQKLTLKGTWKIATPSGRETVKLRRVVVTVNDLVLEEPSLERLKALHRPFIDPAELRAAFAKPLILELSEDGKTMNGILVTIGPLLGHFHFIKGNTKIGVTL
jgi:hypothetical protein